MNRTTTIMTNALVGIAVLFGATAANADYKKGDVVDLTPTLKGTVLQDQTPNSSAVKVEIYQNPDNKPTGAVTINYLYTVGGTDFSVESLASKAFYDNRELTSVTINNAGITSIPYVAFGKCTKLTKFDFSNIRYVNEAAFEYSGLTEAVMPVVWTIGAQAFAWCDSLEKIEVGGECRILDGMAFGQCKALKVAKLNYGLTTIGVNNFTGSYVLTDFVLPYTVNSIQNDLTGSSALSRVFLLSPSVKGWCVAEEEGKAPKALALVKHSMLKEIYVLDELVDDVNALLESYKGQLNMPSSDVIAKPVSDLVEIVPVKGEKGKFTIIKHNEDIPFIEIYKSTYTNSDYDRIYPDNGVYDAKDADQVQIVYTVDKVNTLRYFASVVEPEQPEPENKYPVTEDQVVKMRGDIFFGSYGWTDSDMTKNEDGLWVIENVKVKSGNFGFKLFENAETESYTWVSSAADDTTVVLDETMEGSAEGKNWYIGKGTYTFTFNPGMYELYVTGTPDETPDAPAVWEYVIHGNIENGSDWKNIEMTEENGVWTVSLADIAGGQFGIKSFDTANEKEGPWISSVKGASDPVEVVLGEEMPAATSDNSNWAIGEGSFTFTFNPEANTLLVTDDNEVPVVEPDYYYVMCGKDDAEGEWVDYPMEDNDGSWTLSLEKGLVEFYIKQFDKNAEDETEPALIKADDDNKIEKEGEYKATAEGGANWESELTVKANYVFNPETMVLTVSGTSGIGMITTEESDVIFLNLQGQRIAKPENGVYIRVVGGKAQKVMK